MALAVFAGVALALYGFVNTNFLLLDRLHAAVREEAALRRAVEHVSGIDPGREPGGRIEHEGLVVAWAARLVEPVRASRRPGGEPGRFLVGLYEVVLEVRDGERLIGRRALRIAGHSAAPPARS